jgi:hydrogenase-4 component E
MSLWFDAVLAFLALTNLMFLATSRLGACIRAVAVQGTLVGLLPLLAPEHSLSPRVLGVALGTILLKGAVFPWLLRRVLHHAQMRREVEPLVSYPASTLIGLLTLGLALWVNTGLPLPMPLSSPLVVPVALSTILVGLFVIVSRVKAISQVLGYLILENGIYAFGTALLLEQSIVVELGVLLDIFAAVFVMGIAIFHINREFDHIDTGALDALADWTGPGAAR